MPTTGPTPPNAAPAPNAVPATVPPSDVPTQKLPSMRDLDGLESDLNRIDATLAELDATDDQPAPEA